MCYADPRMNRRGWSLFLVASLLPWAAAAGGCSTSANDSADAGPTTRDPGPLVTIDAGPIEASPSPESAPAPTLTALSPAEVNAGASATPVTLTGTGFVDRSVALVNGAVVASTLKDAEHLQVVFTTAMLANGALLHVSVATSTPGGGTTASLPFLVDNPLPTLSSISPLGASAGGGDVMLTVEGGQFAQAAAVDFDGVPLPTVYASSAQLSARIPSGLIVSGGTHAVTVVNPDPSGGTSTTLVFTVSDSTAMLSAVSPSSANVGSPDVTITVTGTGIEPGSFVTFNGTNLDTTRIDDTRLSAVLPAALLTTSGQFPVSVLGPAAGESPSAPVVFTVNYGAPALTSADPSVLPQGAGDTTLTLHGQGFLSTASTTLDGQPAKTTFVDTATLTVVVPAGLLTTAHMMQVVVSTPLPGGGTSAPLTVPVTSVSPDLLSVSPNSAVVGAGDTTVTFSGSSFVATSVARFDGTALASTFGGASTLTAVIPAALLTSVGSHQLVIDNGAAGGASAPLTFTVGCDSTGVDVVLPFAGTSTTLTVSMQQWAGLPTLPPITDTGSGVCPSSEGELGNQPYIGWVVQNATNSPRSLEAWAVCNGAGDAFLTFFNRSTVPSTLSGELACTGSIAEGTSGYDALGSPESNGADYCPGLTVANGAALPLPVCGKAVVFVQPWNAKSGSFPPPTTFRVDVQ